MSVAFDNYRKKIEKLKSDKATLDELNNLVETMAWDDDITNAEYSELYGEVLAIMCF